MRKLLPLIFTLLLLPACSSGSQSNEESGNTVYSQEEIFQKKVECGKLQTQVESQLKEEEIQINDYPVMMNSLEKIFFSPKRNSCLAISRQEWYEPKTSIVSGTSWRLRDILTNEIILSSGIINAEIDPLNENKYKFDTAVVEYE